MGFHTRHPTHKPFWTAEKMKNRLEWAKDEVNRRVGDWKIVNFSDKWGLSLKGLNGCGTVRRRRKDRLEEDWFFPVFQKNMFLIVWGCVISKGTAGYNLVEYY